MVVAGSRPTSLDKAAEVAEQVKKILAQSPREHGFQKSRWDIGLIQQTISWLGKLTKAGAWSALKRLGFSKKQALGIIRSPDPFFQLKLRSITQAFMRALQYPEQAAILFQDEMSYELKATTRDAWGVTGRAQPRVTHAPKANPLTRIGGAMDGITGKLIYHQTTKFGVEAMQQLYRDIRANYTQKTIFVVQDNWHNVHNHPAVLKTCAELGIIPLFLPTYASWLNPIEKLWRWLRADILHNHNWAGDLAAVRAAVTAFLNQFQQASDDLLHYCGLLPK
jgi:hypothetical protein